jgi:hypothetical protein
MRLDRSNPPRELLDPDGEGIYLLDLGCAGLPEKFGWPLLHACQLFGMGMREYRELRTEVVYMEPGEDDHWFPANTGRFPRYWRLNLPKRWRPVAYTYICPPPS